MRITVSEVKDIDFGTAVFEQVSDDHGTVILDTSSDAFAMVMERQRARRDTPPRGSVFLAWRLFWEYTESEVESADWFHLRIGRGWLDIKGQERTAYDDTTSCRFCGKGRRQLTPLILPKSISKRNIFGTSNDALLLRSKAVETLLEVGAKGFDVCPVVASGTPKAKMLSKFTVGGLDGTIPLEEDRRPIEALASVGDVEFFQVLPVSQGLEFSKQQVTGSSPAFVEEWVDELCPLGHSRGWTLLSPLRSKRVIEPKADWQVMDKTTGSMKGIFMPETHHVVSRKVFLAIDDGIRKRHEFDIVEFD